MSAHSLFTYCLWFNDQAEEAAKFYTSIIRNSSLGSIAHYGKEGFEIHKQPEGKVMTIDFNLGGSSFVGLNGGPQFKFNPSISFFVVCETEEETDQLWKEFINGGTVLMPLDKYDWSEKYGWVQDKYGMSWQVSLGKIEDVKQKVTPLLMFVNKQFGKAEEAVHHYTSIFKNSTIAGILKPEGTVLHAQFYLDGNTFMAIDSGDNHQFDFNEAVSIVVNCDSQKEIDYYWERLSQGGEEGPCGWLKDKFGVSWQVVPVQLQKMLKDPDKSKAGRVTKAFLQMKKFDLGKLEKAYSGN